MPATRIRLICWNSAESQEKAALLADAGYQVDASPFSPLAVRELRHNLPAAVIIDLSRLPSQGRDVALQLRQFKSTRQVALVFSGGDPVKLPRIRELLPDAVYTSWEEIEPALESAIQHPPEQVVAPSSSFAAYAGAPLVQKLGIRPHSKVTLIDAPPSFEQGLGVLPPGVTWCTSLDGPCDLVICFIRSQKDLEEQVACVKGFPGKGGVWMVWPKKGSRIESELTQVLVRKAGLAAGLVDYKICAIDETWTGLRFALRKAKIS